MKRAIGFLALGLLGSGASVTWAGEPPKSRMVMVNGAEREVRIDTEPDPGSPGQVAASTPARPKSRNKALIIGGLAAIGGGLALVIAGPTSTSQSAYTTSTNTKVAGGAIAGMGGLMLYFGAKER